MHSSERAIRTFDTLYAEHGMRSQRTYPNEALIIFVAQNWFHLPFEQRRNIRILEVGCGSGANLWMLAKEGFSVYGVDTSDTGLALAESHLRDKWNVAAQLDTGSALALPYENDFFDAVVDVVTLQHLCLEDSKVALSEVRRVLRLGGKFFSFRLSDRSVMYFHSNATFIDGATVSNIADPALPINNCGPTSFWGPSLASVMYHDSGLKVSSIDTYRRTYQSGQHHVEYLAITAEKPI